MNTSFEIAGLFVPANSLSQHLQHFTAPALFHTDGFGPYHLTKSGSLFKIRIQDRFFCLVCAHQVLGQNAGYDHDQLCLHNQETRKIYTSHRVVFPENDPDFGLDVLLYEFTDIVKDGDLPTFGWFRIKRETITENNPKPLKALSIGYPGYRNSFNYENNHYPVAPSAIWGEEAKPSLAGRLAFVPEPQIDFDPAGMSGSPVFGIRIDDLEPVVFFAGLLTNASARLFHFLPRRRIAYILEEGLRP